MKKSKLLSILLFTFGSIIQAQSQTSVPEYPNLSGTDLSGNSYNLYTELNSGKIILSVTLTAYDSLG